MKKLIGFLSLAAVLIVMACSDKSTEVKKEVVVVPDSRILIKDPPEKPTTIVLDKNGAKVVTKKVDVVVKKQ